MTPLAASAETWQLNRAGPCAGPARVPDQTNRSIALPNLDRRVGAFLPGSDLDGIAIARTFNLPAPKQVVSIIHEHQAIGLHS
jgi:hypothetical protein